MDARGELVNATQENDEKPSAKEKKPKKDDDDEDEKSEKSKTGTRRGTEGTWGLRSSTSSQVGSVGRGSPAHIHKAWRWSEQAADHVVGESMGVRILIVEDEAELADFVVRGLREEGFTVAHAADGEQAWESMRFGEWDLIVLDWWLPGEDGLSVLRRLSSVGWCRSGSVSDGPRHGCRSRARAGRRGG